MKVNSSKWDNFRRQAEVELEQLSRLRLEYKPIVGNALQAEPDLQALSALAVLLHSFYTGAENIFKRAVVEIDRLRLSGESWHRDLLDLIEEPTAFRPALFSSELRNRLDEYLAFRHVFRSAYGFVLNWEKMAPLVRGYEEVHDQLVRELRGFLEQQPASDARPEA